MIEEWKDIPGYESYYQVSNFGRIRSLQYKGRKRMLVLKPIIKRTGYYVVSINRLQKHIHRLVAEAFLPNPCNFPVVDHIDTDKSNNSVENLRWCSIKDNVNNPLSKELRTNMVRRKCYGRLGKDSLTHKAVYQFSITGEFVRHWECMSDACRHYGIDTGSMTRVCQGKSHTAKGFVWRYQNMFEL